MLLDKHGLVVQGDCPHGASASACTKCKESRYLTEIGRLRDMIDRLRADLAETRAIVRVYWMLHDRFSMSPDDLAEHLTRHPWLEEDE